MINLENFKQKTKCISRCQLRFYTDDYDRVAAEHNGDKFELRANSDAAPLDWLIATIGAEHDDA